MKYIKIKKKEKKMKIKKQINKFLIKIKKQK